MATPPDASASSRAPVRIGRYLVFDEIARGGQASVHLGKLIGPDGFTRLVAVKRLQSLFAESEDHARALRDEAKLTARIRHPNVVQTLDAVLADGLLYVVMEYVHGVTLSRLLGAAETGGHRVPVDIAVGIVADALLGLKAAHDAKDEKGAPLSIVHRDVSPHNVQVGADGVARLLDFGIAKSMMREQVTAEGQVKGKIAYMPREQLSGQPVTRQADLYAMGVVLWEAITGKRLFDDPDPARLAVRVLTESVPPPSHHAMDVTPALDAVVVRATSHDARRRFSTADEMLAELLAATPRAEATAIADWMNGPAGDELEIRAERVRAVESYDASAEEAPESARPVVMLVPKVARWRRAAPIAGALAVGVLIAMMGMRRDPLPAPVIAAAQGAQGAVVDPAGKLAAPAQPVSEAAIVELDDPSHASPAPARAPADALPKAATSVLPRSAKHRPAPHAACDPPYSIDANGWKHYKPQCLP